MFSKVLIANRGEIACRIAQTCRRLGVASVAVYSEADAGSRHVSEADEAVCIGPAPAAQSYLQAERIAQAALATGAQAIHPGYGFLSEKLELVDACARHGLVFVGPHREAIARMGSKIESKRIARAAGVACVPGYDGDDQDDTRLAAEAVRIGFPVLIKASAGGGGKGMRRVDHAADFAAQLALARKEALAAFGDTQVLLEKCIVRPRHLEVQLFGDRHGGLLHLFERECSIQRRFQKLIEEAPAPHLAPAVADQLYAAALRLGRHIGYDNAGTVEFVLDADQSDTPYFLEVNTRLQVEHPVTELTTGIDLVAWQLRVAAGEPLPLTQDQVRRQGWAIEARVNAEDPAHGHRASLGTVLDWAEPSGPGLRVDSGLHTGSEVTPHYDALLAKVIGFGASRAQAAARLRAGLAGLRSSGVVTNAGLLRRVLAHPAFDEVLSTGFLDTHALPADDPGLWLATAAAWAVAQAERVAAPGAWGRVPGFRLAAACGLDGAAARLEIGGQDLGADQPLAPAWLVQRDGLAWWQGQPGHQARAGAPTATGGRPVWLHAPADPADPGHAGAAAAGREAWVQPLAGGRWFASCEGEARVFVPQHGLALAAAAPGAAEHDGAVRAGLPGRVSECLVAAGAEVEAGQALFTLEAMKLYHTLAAPRAGRLRALHVAVGEVVGQGQLLAEIDPGDLTPMGDA